MSNAAAIEALERRFNEMERKANALLDVINDLRSEDGLPPHRPLGSGGGGAGSGPASATSLTSIRPDTFYGKKLQTAIREYLEMRKASGGVGPAKPREIFDAITAGGYQFEAKEETTALVGMRALLRKRSNMFHKLPGGEYGLLSWYPDAKQKKERVRLGDAGSSETETDDEDDDDATSDDQKSKAVA